MTGAVPVAPSRPLFKLLSVKDIFRRKRKAIHCLLIDCFFDFPLIATLA